jgi:hypothetical protein
MVDSQTGGVFVRMMHTVKEALGMRRPLTFVFLSVILLHSTSGCGGIAASRYVMLPPGLATGTPDPRDPSGVSLLKQGVKPPKSCVRLAKLWIKGDPYTTREALENRLRFEGAKVGADFVLVTGHKEIEDNSTPHFAEYGAGIPIADDVKNPYLFGLACRAASAGLGVELSKDWSVKTVLPGSAAEKIGLQPGDRLVSINGSYLRDHEYTYDRDILSRSPGESVTIEYLTKEGRKAVKDARLDVAR